MKAYIPGIEFEFCKGIQRGCSNAIITIPNLIEELINIGKKSYWTKKFPINSKGIKHHKLLKVGISGCPNACAKSQIKDVGVISKINLGIELDLCQSCLKCIDVCKEGALGFKKLLTYDKQDCVGCAKCTQTCPSNALYPSWTYFEIMLGGRLGRHPRFAKPILKIEPKEFLIFFEFFLNLFEKYPEIKQAKQIFNHLSPEGIKNAYIKKQNNRSYCSYIK